MRNIVFPFLSYASHLGRRAAILLLGLWLVMPHAAIASGGQGIVRDAEMEELINDYSLPLIEAAGLSPKLVKIFIINNSSINAFVAGGQNIFLNTGLIIKAQTPNVVTGVIAHELGHITGGHLSRSEPELRKAKLYQAASWILGLASIMAGAADVGSALVLGGAQMGERSYLKFSRVQEASADEAAIKLLHDTQQSPQGLLSMLKILGERLKYYRGTTGSNLDPYALTHPLPKARIDALTQAVQKSPYRDQRTGRDLLWRHTMLRAKLQAYLEEPKVVFKLYAASDLRAPALYARAIAHHREGKLEPALKLIDELQMRFPQNPWFHELEGQMLFESGRAQAAIAPYEASLKLKPKSALLYIGLAVAQKATGNPELIAASIRNLRQALRYESDNVTAMFQLSTAYGLAGETAHAQLALAEYYARLGNMQRALRQAERAQRGLKKHSPEWLQADDILSMARAEQAKRDKERNR